LPAAKRFAGGKRLQRSLEFHRQLIISRTLTLNGIGWDWLNLVSTIGAFVFAAGVPVVVFDVLRPKQRQPRAGQNPWNAGTLEWLNEPEENWGVRSIPPIESRYPLWDQKELAEKVNAGVWYLSDALDGRRETLISSVLDAHPVQCQRVAGPSVLPMLSAAFLGGVFIALTFELWFLALLSGLATLAAILWWLWTGTGEIPERKTRDVGLGLRLPFYISGPESVGWWAMFITMVGDGMAFASLIFGYFFYWTIHADFTAGQAGPGWWWPMAAAGLFLAAWAAMLAARQLNANGSAAAMRLALVLGALLALGACTAGLAGPWLHGMQPTVHVYPAIVWILVAWLLAHAAAGLLMQLYCVARSLAGRLSPEHDMELHNVVLYWHFMTISAVIACAVIGLFPEAM
jgi:cytochrome c oxidase subunit I+III